MTAGEGGAAAGVALGPVGRQLHCLFGVLLRAPAGASGEEWARTQTLVYRFFLNIEGLTGHFAVTLQKIFEY